MPKFGRDLKSLNQSENKNTLANTFTYCPIAFKRKAFTLAEVLITLAIIGVVSAIVIPTVIKNYNDRKYNTARLKALKTFGEAGKMASINDEMNTQANAKDFVNNVLSKYLKISKVCDNAVDCAFPSQIQPSNPSEIKVLSNRLQSWYSLNTSIQTANSLTSISDTGLSTYFTSVDGYSAKLFFNPKCIRNFHENPIGTCNRKSCNIDAIDAACMNIIYDMNGIEEPNHVGEDIGFVTIFWSGLNAIAVAPGIVPYSASNMYYSEGRKKNSEASVLCASSDSSSTTYTLPNIYELLSLVLNKNLSSILPGTQYWSSSVVLGDESNMWSANINGYCTPRYGSNTPFSVWCVRR